MAYQYLSGLEGVFQKSESRRAKPITPKIQLHKAKSRTIIVVNPLYSCSLWQTFPLKDWITLLIMMILGMSLRLIPNFPSQFIAFFYLGLGPMLILFATKFILYFHKTKE
jgi:hypothetical protein